MRTWQFIAVATALYFGSAAPAAADELPLVQIPADAAAVVETITAEVAPDVAPIVAEVTAPQPEAAATAPSPPTVTAVSATEPSQESQYHEPEPQYQAPATTDVEPASDASGAPDASVSEDSAAAVSEENAASTAEPNADPAATTTAATVDEPAAAATGAPDTWTWNWNWNCDPASAPPAELPADASAPTWVWNWNWNCDAQPDAGANSAQYQGGGSQYQPQNTNVSIRIGSPGDNGPVEQTIAAAAAAVATSVSSVAETIVSSALADVGTTSPAPAPNTAPPVLVVPDVPSIVIGGPLIPPIIIGGPLVPPLELPLVPVPQISLPAFPPLEIPLAPVVGVPVATAIVGAVEEALDAAGVQVAATAHGGAAAAPSRPRSANAREPQHAARAGAGASWSVRTGVLTTASPRVQSHGARSSTGSPTSPGLPPRPRLPLPNAPALGGAQLSSSANGVLGAFAALLAAYLLFPYLAGRPVRASRDRRRLSPRAARLEKPG